MCKLVNLTPHAINIVKEDGTSVLNVPSSGLARCKATTVRVGYVTVDINNKTIQIPQTKTVFGEVYGLPEETEGTIYVVSRVVAEATGRSDLRVPNESVRNSDGAIVGCLSLGII